MTTLNQTTPDLVALQRQLVGRFARFRQRVRTHLVLEGAARVMAIAVGLILLSFVADRVFRLGLGSRVVFLLGAVGVVAWQAWRHVVRPLRLRLDPVDLATAIDRREASLAGGKAGRGRKAGASDRAGNGNAGASDSGGNRKAGASETGGNGKAWGNGHAPVAARVAAVLQLPELLRADRPPSAPMVRRAVQRSYESLEAIDFDAQLDRRRRHVAVGALVALALLPLLLAAAFPAAASLWAKRWLLASNVAWPQRTYLIVAGLEDNRILVPRGEPHVLRVGIREGSVEPESVSIDLRVGRGKTTTASLTRFGPGDFRYDLPPLQSEATVELAGGDDEFGPFRVETVDRPRVVELALTSKHPRQAQPDVRKFSGVDAEMAFLPKTELDLTFTSNVPVAEVKLKSSAAHPDPSKLRRLTDRSFSLPWTHEAAVQLSFELVGQVGGLASVPTPVSFGLKTDAPPRVTIQYTGVRQRITPQARVPLNVQSRDDYGLAKVDLATRIELSAPPDQGAAAPPPREGAVPLLGPADPAVELEAQQKHEFDVNAEKLTPGALLSFTSRATDASYTGAQTGRSRTVTFRVVAPEELFREILLRQQAERARFRKAISESEKIRAELNGLATPEAAGRLARQQRVIQREVARIATTLSESVVEMRLNALGGQEAWDLMEGKIVTPLRALNDADMTRQRDAFDALAKALDPQKVAEAGTRQDEIVSTMNEILKQMSQWDSFVDVLNQLNEIIRLQDTVRKSTEKLKDAETEGVFE